MTDMQNKTHQAVIFANKPPNEKQKAGFMAFLTKNDRDRKSVV